MAETPLVAPRSDPTRMAVAFARLLRAAGLAAPVGSVLTFADALGEVGAAERDAVYWAGRATLVQRPEDQPVFDRAFAVFWEGRRPVAGRDEEPPSVTVTLAVDTEEEEQPGAAADRGDEPTITLRFSAHEVLRDKDFAAYTRAELAEAHQLMAELRLAGARRPSRRLVPSRRLRGRPDLRRTVRSALRAGGEPVRRHHLEASQRSRRLILLLDISGSMEPYARALLRFVHAAVVGPAAGGGLRPRHPAHPVDPRAVEPRSRHRAAEGLSLGARLVGWHPPRGGPAELQRPLGRARAWRSGAVVVILSDGWDRGEPDALAEQMRRLSRVAFRVVWVNPLKVTPGYAPLARGMAAALPYVDDFVEGHSLAAMERLAEVISR